MTEKGSTPVLKVNEEDKVITDSAEILGYLDDKIAEPHLGSPSEIPERWDTCAMQLMASDAASLHEAMMPQPAVLSRQRWCNTCDSTMPGRDATRLPVSADRCQTSVQSSIIRMLPLISC